MKLRQVRLMFYVFLSLIFGVSIPPAYALGPESEDSRIMDALRFTVMVKSRIYVGLGGDQKTTETRPFLGSGMVVDAKQGLVLTSRHVVTKSPADISVIFHNKEKVSAKRIYVDPQMDLAILKVDPEKVNFKWTQAEFQESSGVRPGHPVLSFGHPLGYEFSASRGIISSHVRKEIGYGRFYQSDTVIGGGNSGGPLISMRTGRVLGMNTYRTSNDGTQLTFSLVADDFVQIVQEVRKMGSVKSIKRGEVGVQFSRVEDERLKGYFKDLKTPPDLFSQGMFVVASVRPNSSGYRAGLRPFDVLYSVGNIIVMQNTIDQANRYVDMHVDQTIPIQVVREGKLLELNMPVEDASRFEIKDYVFVTGIAAHNVTPETPGYAISDQLGVEIGDIMADAQGDRGTLRSYDVIKGVNGKQIKNLQDFLDVLLSVREGSKVEVLYQRFTQDFNVGFGISQLEVLKPRMLNINDPFPVE
jgi:S1-C subfamily serine protease